MTAPLQVLDPEIQQLLLGVAPPVAVGIPVLLLAWRPWRRNPPFEGGGWGVSLALALGFTGAYVALMGWAFLTPNRGMEWLPYIGLAAAAVGLGARSTGRAIQLVAALSVAAAFAMLYTLWQGRMAGGAIGMLHVGVVAAALMLFAAVMVPLGTRSRGPALPMALTLVASAGGYVLVAGAQATSLGQLAGALAAGLGLCTAVALWNREFSMGRSGTLVFVMLLGGLLRNGYYNNFGLGELPLLPCALVAVAAVMAWVERLPFVATRSTPVRCTITLVATAIPLAAAAWLAYQISTQYEYY